jgi:predicted ATP-binding protein involved in virulence
LLFVDAGLFGQFNHDLKFGETTPKNTNLLILYGENGTGKTTLLWLVYHRLNKELAAGHRTYLSQFRFKKLCVTFSDSLEISESRDEPSGGGFFMQLPGAAPFGFKACGV